MTPFSLFACSLAIPCEAMSEREPDSLHRFLFEDFPLRGELVRLDATWREVLARYDYPPAVRGVLGETLAAAALLAATIKFSGHLTIQLHGDGALSLLVVQCDSELHLRGLARWEGEGEQSAEKLLGEGRLVITIEPDDGGERYQGIVPAAGGSIAAIIGEYFERSEQLSTRLWLAAGAHSVAGLLLQRLPGDSEDADAWNRTGQLAGTVTTEELRELPAEQLLQRLFHEETVRLFESHPVSFHCGCSRERIESVIQGLGVDEARTILQEQGAIRVACEFCNRRYQLDAVDVAALFATPVAVPSGNSSAQH